ncbi:MAG TPA: hypothetical protein VHW44_17590 [Pseudonocardiaceae bacterium]|jgi:predicted dehydrogenase|nr:hypothetical protein [Pseudonocardiaceae bacterium]
MPARPRSGSRAVHTRPAHFQDGRLTNAHTRLEIAGTEGSLTLESHGPASGGGIQLTDLPLFGARSGDADYAELSTPDDQPIDASAAVGNVTRLYRTLARDLRTDAPHTPDFAAGLRLHRPLDTIRLSASTGTKQTVN